MLLRVISILTVYFITSSVSNAAIIPSSNRENHLLESEPKLAMASSNIPIDRRVIAPNLMIINGRLALSRSLQIELAKEITEAQKCLVKLNDFIDKQTEAKIGLVYIHQGYENWSLQFTYGGYLLDVPENMIINTSNIPELKKIFSQTKSLKITDKNYQTTRSLDQLGPILHES